MGKKKGGRGTNVKAECKCPVILNEVYGFKLVTLQDDCLALGEALHHKDEGLMPVPPHFDLCYVARFRYGRDEFTACVSKRMAEDDPRGVAVCRYQVALGNIRLFRMELDRRAEQHGTRRLPLP